jgi:GTP cyclohydrolase IA
MPQGTFDFEAVKSAVRQMLIAMGEDPDREGLIDTPDRVARMYQVIFKGYLGLPMKTPPTFDKEEYDGIVTVTNVPFFSYCEHHMVPYFGNVTIAYQPGDDGKVIGLSKLVRLFRRHVCRLSIQERITAAFADELMKLMGAKGVYVHVKAEHMCMTMRGVRAVGSQTVTSAARGSFKKSDALRSQVLAEIKGV